ncbi:MAG: MFS transporter [Chloroflexi bacterium]|nr:MFS transporter [Chloroflexota bacterium]
MATRNGFTGRLEQSFGSLKSRDFRYLIFSSGALGFGQWFQQIGLGWLVFQQTGSPGQMGGIAAVRGLVFLLVSPPAGILCDRMSRRFLIIASTGVAVLQALGLAILVGSGRAELWHLYIFSMVEGAASAVNQPARQAFVYDVVEKESLTSAVTLNSVAQNLARVSGPAIAGTIIGFAGTASVFYILVGLKILAMLLTMLISPRTRQVIPTHQVKPLRDMWEGLRYAWGDKAILGLVVLGIIPTLLIYPYVQFLPFFASRFGGEGEVGARTYGILATGVGWGSLVGLSGLVMMGDLRAKGKVMLVAQALYPVAVALFALAGNFAMAMVFLVMAGVFNSINTTLQNTLFLLLSREEVRGRVMSLHSMTGGLQPIGSLTMGLGIEYWGATPAIAGFMAVSIVCILLTAALFVQMRRA